VIAGQPYLGKGLVFRGRLLAPPISNVLGKLPNILDVHTDVQPVDYADIEWFSPKKARETLASKMYDAVATCWRQPHRPEFGSYSNE
jgi:hypothetical protein